MKWAIAGPASRLGGAARGWHIEDMRLKFISRKPKPRPAAVGPLKEIPAAGGAEPAKAAARPKELGGPSGPEPTRYGDWERKGICVDF
jgi:hypothetical protein